MFILAPTMVTGVNQAKTNLVQINDFIPAQFAQETLRVAVYTEPNTSLPAYAEGGTYTSYYANVIALLQSQGFAVTALSTQDILDHKLMAAHYDVFILPNQLPKDEIIYLVKDYWLAGGGILSFDGSIGYLLYMGMIHPSLEGDFGLVGFGPLPYYWYNIPYLNNINVTERYPVTKEYQVNNVLSYNENATVWNHVDLASLLGDSLHILAIDGHVSVNGAIGAFDNPDRGGRIVQIPGNCSSFTAWQSRITADAIDWLAPRPKARIAFDFSKIPFYGVDTWDQNVTHVPRYNIWRDFLVNHSYTVDKLYPPAGGELTTSLISIFDVLIINLPMKTYSTEEMTDVIRPFVANGGGLFYLTDFNGINDEGHINMNELIAPWGFNITDDYTQMPFDTTTDLDEHPIREGISNIYLSGGEWVNITGDAFSIIRFGPNVAVAGCDVGQGRVIVSGDINFLDHNTIVNDDNVIFAVNSINWLSSGAANVLLFNDDFIVENKYDVAPAEALRSLGINFYLTHEIDYFNLSLYEYWSKWDLVIFDMPGFTMSGYFDNIRAWVEFGGKLILSYYQMASYSSNPLWPLLGVLPVSSAPDEPDIYVWQTSHPIFNIPVDYAASLFEPIVDYGSEGSLLHVFSNATSLAGYTAVPEENKTAIAIRNDHQTLVNAFLIDEFQGDYDNSTYMDSLELWVNEIGFIYFDRPIIDHPADVTYMETETGNEITWTPVADAGPWNYVLRVNGTITQSGKWLGGPITFNIDGVNKSITEYQLTVYDKLGYSVSDTVTLNVTEYIPTTTTTTNGGGVPVDPMLLAIIALGVAAVLIVVIIIIRRGKK